MPRGFTLIEMLVAMAVLALLAAIALPAYNENVARGRRSDMQTKLMEDAQYLQRYYSANATYATASSLPASQAPSFGAANYTITIATQSASDFKLLAARTPGGAMANDRCGDFTYDSLGARGLSGTPLQVPDCWR
jgi:type IV pilus assembly protein PilE